MKGVDTIVLYVALLLLFLCLKRSRILKGPDFEASIIHKYTGQVECTNVWVGKDSNKGVGRGDCKWPDWANCR